MGILNMGPAAAISLIAYFRGLRAAFSGMGTLSNVGRLDDPHPADILRGFLGASVVRLLGFEDAYAWAEVIEKETMRDVTSIRIGNVPVTVAQAKKSADVVAATIALGRLTTLGNHALIDIQNWQNADEAIATTLQSSLLTNEPVDPTHVSGIYAAHIVAAAVTAALAGKGAIGDIFQRMVAVLKDMHDANAAWGPLYVIHPGDIHRDMTLDSLNRRDESVQPGLAQLIDLRSPAAVTARA
jgi:hypothetical protein